MTKICIVYYCKNTILNYLIKLQFITFCSLIKVKYTFLNINDVYYEKYGKDLEISYLSDPKLLEHFENVMCNMEDKTIFLSLNETGILLYNYIFKCNNKFKNFYLINCPFDNYFDLNNVDHINASSLNINNFVHSLNNDNVIENKYINYYIINFLRPINMCLNFIMFITSKLYIFNNLCTLIKNLNYINPFLYYNIYNNMCKQKILNETNLTTYINYNIDNGFDYLNNVLDKINTNTTEFIDDLSNNLQNNITLYNNEFIDNIIDKSNNYINIVKKTTNNILEDVSNIKLFNETQNIKKKRAKIINILKSNINNLKISKLHINIYNSILNVLDNDVKLENMNSILYMNTSNNIELYNSIVTYIQETINAISYINIDKINDENMKKILEKYNNNILKFFEILKVGDINDIYDQSKKNTDENDIVDDFVDFVEDAIDAINGQEVNVQTNDEHEGNVQTNGEQEENVETNGEQEGNVETNDEHEGNVETNVQQKAYVPYVPKFHPKQEPKVPKEKPKVPKQEGIIGTNGKQEGIIGTNGKQDGIIGTNGKQEVNKPVVSEPVVSEPVVSEPVTENVE